MNVKKSAKKVFAIATGLALVGTTIMGALAYDLSNYPAPFVQDGMAKGVIVVGQNAATSDVLGAIDIAASLQAAAVTGTEIAGSNSVNVEGGKSYDKLPLNNAWSGATLRDTKLAGFVDSSFDFDDNTIDYHDELTIVSGKMTPTTSRVEKDFGKDIYMTMLSDAVEYRVYFDDNFDYANVGDTANNHDSNIEFNFLGKDMKVTSFGSDNTSMNVESSSENYMQEGDSVTVDGHKVTLKRVGSSSVLVDVDGQIKSVSDSGSIVKFEDAGDFEVSTTSLFYIDGATDNSATLKLGNSLTESAKSGKSAEMFGQPSKDDEADFWWDINMNPTSGKPYVGIVQKIDRKDLKVSSAEDRAAMALGDSLDLPNNYASVKFAALETSAYDDLTITVDNDLSKLSDGNTGGARTSGDAVAVKFKTDGDYLLVDGTDETSEVWFVEDNSSNSGVWYKDGNNEAYMGNVPVSLTIDAENVGITFPPTATTAINYSNQSTGYKFSFPGTSENLTIFANANNDYFGLKDSEEAEELQLNNSMDIGSKDYDYVTDYGVVIKNPKDQFGSGNTFVMSVPSEQQKATIVVSSKGSTVSAGSEGGMSYTVNPIALGLGVLDTDTTLGSKPMIIVGGPRANTVAADFLGNPTDAQIANTFEAGKALIKYDDAKKAMLVAGWDKQETLGASYVVAKYKNYDFSGNEMEVTVTDLSNIEVNAVN